jgi:hypothetical protein
MKITFAIGVCTEHIELRSLLNFLNRVKDPEDDINVLVDTTKATPEVWAVIKAAGVTACIRNFDNNFAAHRNFHIEQCTGDYIFMIDADEIPQEHLIKTIKGVIQETAAELIFVPRMNLCPGYTQEWLFNHKFQVNEAGWINWPDYQGRVFKREPYISWGRSLHEKVEGAKKTIGLEASPKNGLWHVKTVEKQDSQGQFYDSLPPR